MVKNELIICECHSTEHTIIMSYFEEDVDFPVVYTSIHLSKLPLLQRIKYAIKYVLGYQCRYGAFEEILIGKKEVDKLQTMVDYLKSEKNG